MLALGSYFIPAAVLFRSVIIRVLELISAKMAVEKFLLVVTVEPPRLEQDVEGAGGSAHCRTRTVSAARCSAHHAPSCGALCATKKVGVFIWSLQLFSLFNTSKNINHSSLCFIIKGSATNCACASVTSQACS